MQINGQIEFTITEKTSDHVTAEMPIQAGILNPFGTVHAGATLWFADVTATVLVLESFDATEGMKGFPLAINLNAHLTGNSKKGIFHAQAKYVKRGKSVSIVRTTVTDNNGRLVAEVTTSHVPSA
ncbi:MAG: PaaI family thioesterase [Deltaproteobacteria bacterium]|nr:PaaI family thioesterase [Deltaproteobacteria bacterium]